MRKGRPKVALILTAEERQRLESFAHRSRSAAALARRARIILAWAEGTDSKVVARRLHVTPGTVCKWCGRFIVDRLEGLYDEPRSGATRSITHAQVEDVIIRTLDTTPRGATHWSTRGMAKAVGLSHTAIRRIGRIRPGFQKTRSQTPGTAPRRGPPTRPRWRVRAVSQREEGAVWDRTFSCQRSDHSFRLDRD